MRLTPDQVQDIRKKYELGISKAEIARIYRVSYAAVSYAINPEPFKASSKKYAKKYKTTAKRSKETAEIHKESQLTGELVRQLREIYDTQHPSISDLAKEFKITYSLLYLIVKRKIWTHEIDGLPAREKHIRRHGCPPLTDEAVAQIRIAYHELRTPMHVTAEYYGVTTKTISDIIWRRTWKHVQETGINENDLTRPPAKQRKKLSEQDVIDIRTKWFDENWSPRDLELAYDLPLYTIERIIRRETYKHVVDPFHPSLAHLPLDEAKELVRRNQLPQVDVNEIPI